MSWFQGIHCCFGFFVVERWFWHCLFVFCACLWKVLGKGGRTAKHSMEGVIPPRATQRNATLLSPTHPLINHTRKSAANTGGLANARARKKPHAPQTKTKERKGLREVGERRSSNLMMRGALHDDFNLGLDMLTNCAWKLYANDFCKLLTSKNNCLGGDWAI